jgi:hypothetical protein
MMGDSDYKALVNMIGASVTHPCIKCTMNKDDNKHTDESLKEIVPTMCLTDIGRVVETIVARTVETDNDNVTDTKERAE